MIHVQPQERPCILIDGVTYVVAGQQAKLLDALLKANGETVPHERLEHLLHCGRATIQVYVCQLRRILEAHGYSLRNDFGLGYRFPTH